MLIDYLPIAIYLIIAIGFAAIVVLLSSVLGPKVITKVKLSPYECGMQTIGKSQIRFDVKFYVIAMLFIIFDIEAVFLYPWAVVFKNLGLFGIVEMFVFIFILLAGLLYLWKKGALEWE